MKNLYEPPAAQEIKQRLDQLQPDSPRQWGTMTPAQAVAHCATPLEWAVGDGIPERIFLGRIIGRIIKPLALKDDKPMRRNSPTAKSLIIQGDRNLRIRTRPPPGINRPLRRLWPAGLHQKPPPFLRPPDSPRVVNPNVQTPGPPPPPIRCLTLPSGPRTACLGICSGRLQPGTLRERSRCSGRRLRRASFRI